MRLPLVGRNNSNACGLAMVGVMLTVLNLISSVTSPDRPSAV
jgi:hypothetical protein